MIECTACDGRGVIEVENMELAECHACLGTGTLRTYRRCRRPPEPRTMSLASVGGGHDRLIEFDVPPHREIDPKSLTEEQLLDIEKRHGWKVKREV